MATLHSFSKLWTEYKQVILEDLETPASISELDDYETRKQKLRCIQEFNTMRKQTLKRERILLEGVVHGHNLHILRTWIQNNQSRPYLFSSDLNERRLAKWYHKHRCDPNVSSLITEIPTNWAKEYKEHIYRHGHPKSRSSNSWERKLSHWRFQIRKDYTEGLLSQDTSTVIITALGEAFLPLKAE